MPHSRKTITLSPIQAEIIYTLTALHNRSGTYDDGSRTLASIIFGHFSHSSSITRAVNSIIKKSDNQLITSNQMPYINIASLNKMGIRTTSADELWEDLIKHPDIYIQTNNYVVCLRRDLLCGEYTLRPSYLTDPASERPTFGSLSSAKKYLFRQSAAKDLKLVLQGTAHFNEELLRKASGRQLFWLSTTCDEKRRSPKILHRAMTPHVLTLS